VPLTAVSIEENLWQVSPVSGALRSAQPAHGASQAGIRVARDEAIGTFYRLALDIAAELKKGDDGLRIGESLKLDYNPHPRQLLRSASAVFAPLGNTAIMALNSVGLALDDYFAAVPRYNREADYAFATMRLAEEKNRITTLRAMVGNHLDVAEKQIPADLRWKDASGEEFVFRTRCALPPPREGVNGAAVRL